MVAQSINESTGVGTIPRLRTTAQTNSFFSPSLGSNPTEHKLLTPTPSPTTKKGGTLKIGTRGLKIKTFIGGSFCRAK